MNKPNFMNKPTFMKLADKILESKNSILRQNFLSVDLGDFFSDLGLRGRKK